MPLLFFIDKDILEDPACKNVEDVVLSYTFFRSVHFLHLNSELVLSNPKFVEHEEMREVNWSLMQTRIQYKHPLASVVTKTRPKLKRVMENPHNPNRLM